MTTSTTSRMFAVRITGGFFAATAVGNALGTLRIAAGFLDWLRAGSWLPPFSWALKRLVPFAPAVVAAVAVFQAVIAYQLLRLRHVQAALRLAQLFVLGLIPCLAWPYWLVNVALTAAFEAVRRMARNGAREKAGRSPASLPTAGPQPVRTQGSATP